MSGNFNNFYNNDGYTRKDESWNNSKKWNESYNNQDRHYNHERQNSYTARSNSNRLAASNNYYHPQQSRYGNQSSNTGSGGDNTYNSQSSAYNNKPWQHRNPNQNHQPYVNNTGGGKRRLDSDSSEQNTSNNNSKFSKKKKKPLSQNVPTKRDWTKEEAEKAIEVEKEYNKRYKHHSLIIKFPDLELNKEIVSKFHSAIDNVHFQQPSTARFCFVTLRENEDGDAVITELNKQKFGDGYLTAEYKKDREDDQILAWDDIDPLTLYVGNLAQDITKQDMQEIYPTKKRIDIGFAKKMKYTRYAFVTFWNVTDAVGAFMKTHSTQLHSKSLIVRFRRLHGTVGMPGEPKLQNPPKNKEVDMQSGNISSCDESEGRNMEEVEQDTQDHTEPEQPPGTSSATSEYSSPPPLPPPPPPPVDSTPILTDTNDNDDNDVITGDKVIAGGKLDQAQVDLSLVKQEPGTEQQTTFLPNHYIDLIMSKHKPIPMKVESDVELLKEEGGDAVKTAEGNGNGEVSDESKPIAKEGMVGNGDEQEAVVKAEPDDTGDYDDVRGNITDFNRLYKTMMSKTT